MTEQMTQAGAFLLVAAVAVFWIVIAALVRVHAQRRRPHARGDTPMGGVAQ